MNYTVKSAASNDVSAITDLLAQAHTVNLKLNELMKQQQHLDTARFFPNNYKQTAHLFKVNSQAIATLSDQLLNSLGCDTFATNRAITVSSALSTPKKKVVQSPFEQLTNTYEVLSPARPGFKRRRLQTDVSFLSPQKTLAPLSPQKKVKPDKKTCKVPFCDTKAIGKLGLCKKHGGGKRCTVEGCNKASQGKNGKCVSHGGGKRCIHPGCSKLARGRTNLCIPHGGGNRCEVADCSKLAQGGTRKCIRHGGGKRCKFVETLFVPGKNLPKTVFCQKSAVASTHYCVAHGGGKRCQHLGCKKGAVGKTEFCVRHGGGKRCETPGCTKSAVGKSDRCISCGGTR